jgi:hypothetical protein
LALPLNLNNNRRLLLLVRAVLTIAPQGVAIDPLTALLMVVVVINPVVDMVSVAVFVAAVVFQEELLFVEILMLVVSSVDIMVLTTLTAPSSAGNCHLSTNPTIALVDLSLALLTSALVTVLPHTLTLPLSPNPSRNNLLMSRTVTLLTSSMAPVLSLRITTLSPSQQTTPASCL